MVWSNMCFSNQPNYVVGSMYSVCVSICGKIYLGHISQSHLSLEIYSLLNVSLYFMQSCYNMSIVRCTTSWVYNYDILLTEIYTWRFYSGCIKLKWFNLLVTSTVRLHAQILMWCYMATAWWLTPNCLHSDISQHSVHHIAIISQIVLWKLYWESCLHFVCPRLWWTEKELMSYLSCRWSG